MAKRESFARTMPVFPQSEGVRLCRAAEVKTLAIFHHDPDHEDLFMERLESEARSTWMGAFVAREHMRFNLA